MGYRIDIDHANCINCGVCMDVCPVEALDMRRPATAGIEIGSEGGGPLAWMMEHPIQVGECIGCGICIRECPPNVMTLVADEGADAAGRRARAPIERPTPRRRAAGFRCRPSPARRSSRHHDSPCGDLFTLADALTAEAVAGMAVDGRRTLPRRRSRRARRPARPAPTPAATSAWSAAGRYDEAYAVAAEVNPFPSVCGWICTAPCESACRRGVLDEPISIRTIKRFAVEHGKLPAVAAARDRSGPSGSPSSAAAPPACRPRTTSPASATGSPSSRRCRCRAG